MKRVIDFIRFSKLDWYVLRQYLGPFFVTFFVSWFVLIMQFLWKYIDDFIGKGVELPVLAKFMTYASTSLIPMALPLAILLTSIMTMGNLAENLELTAAKASGISLFRFFRSTIVFSLLVVVFAFFYSNYIYTKTEAVYKSMLGDIRMLKSALVIKPKQFYTDLPGVGIRVEEKNEKTGELFGIKVYSHDVMNGNPTLLLAKRGSLVQSPDGKVLIFKLDTVLSYKDDATSSFDNLKYPFYIWTFDHYEKRFDLSQFKLGEPSKNPDGQFLTKNVLELNQMIDSSKTEEKIIRNGYSNKFNAMNIAFQSGFKQSYQVRISDSMKSWKMEEKTRFKTLRSTKLRNVKNNLFIQNSELSYKQKLRDLMLVEWHNKFTLAISCIVLFFVGAPLGAIIRKGGIGLPMIFAIILFILYYFSGVIGKALVEAEHVPPIIGTWMSTVLFLPAGIYLTIKAKNDSQLLNIDGYKHNIQNWFQKYVLRK